MLNVRKPNIIPPNYLKIPFCALQKAFRMFFLENLSALTAHVKSYIQLHMLWNIIYQCDALSKL